VGGVLCGARRDGVLRIIINHGGTGGVAARLRAPILWGGQSAKLEN
jgi:hypothetical protein